MVNKVIDLQFIPTYKQDLILISVKSRTKLKDLTIGIVIDF